MPMLKQLQKVGILLTVVKLNDRMITMSFCSPLLNFVIYHMYSERYRDLIDAADSIVDMKKCSELVSLHV